MSIIQNFRCHLHAELLRFSRCDSAECIVLCRGYSAAQPALIHNTLQLLLVQPFRSVSVKEHGLVLHLNTFEELMYAMERI